MLCNVSLPPPRGRAGVLVGDLVCTYNGETVTNKPGTYLTDALANNNDTIVRFGVRRGDAANLISVVVVRTPLSLSSGGGDSGSMRNSVQSNGSAKQQQQQQQQQQQGWQAPSAVSGGVGGSYSGTTMATPGGEDPTVVVVVVVLVLVLVLVVVVVVVVVGVVVVVVVVVGVVVIRWQIPQGLLLRVWRPSWFRGCINLMVPILCDRSWKRFQRLREHFDIRLRQE